MTNEESFLGAVAEQLRAERAASGLTLTELNEKSGVARASLHKFEKGIRVPDLRQMEQICGVLGMSVSEFLARVDARVGDPKPPTADDFGLAAHRPKIAHESMEDDGDHAE